MKMIATEKHPKAKAGAEVNVPRPVVRFYKAKGWAVPSSQVQAAKAEDEMEALRAEFERVTGEKARSNWKPETIQRKIEEAGKTYRRRDMRAED